MQYRRQGRKIQVLAYRGYDRERRRAIVKMMGSYDAYTYEMSDGLLESLTEDEKKELLSHIESDRQAYRMQSRQYAADTIGSRIRDVADILEAGEYNPSEAWAERVWAALDALARAMRKAGHPKPRKAPQKAAGATMQGQAGLPLGDTAETP